MFAAQTSLNSPRQLLGPVPDHMSQLMHHDAAVTVGADTDFRQTVRAHPDNTSAGQRPSTISRVASSRVGVNAPYRDAMKRVIGIVAFPT